MKIPAPLKSGAKSLRDNTSFTYRIMTNRWRLLPDFLIIGGQRCGTTSLYYYLINYPGILPAHTKEVHYFDVNYEKGPGWYRAQFPTLIGKTPASQGRKHPYITGEASPYYLFHPHAPARIASARPVVKLIALLRNPVDRAYSQHWLEVKSGYETLSFKDAIEREQERLAGEWEKMLADEHYDSFNYRHYSYLARGKYVEQLQTWMGLFPKEQLLLLRSEDLYTNPAAVVQQTLEFLGVFHENVDLRDKEYRQYRLPLKTGYKGKQTASHPKMDADIKRSLLDYFRPYNARLTDLMGRNPGWDEEQASPETKERQEVS